MSSHLVCIVVVMFHLRRRSILDELHHALLVHGHLEQYRRGARWHLQENAIPNLVYIYCNTEGLGEIRVNPNPHALLVHSNLQQYRRGGKRILFRPVG